MDESEFIEKLNEDLGTEFQSIVQHVQDTASIKAAEQGRSSLSSAIILARSLSMPRSWPTRSTSNSGTPTVQVPAVPDCPAGATALKADLALEERQLQRYRDRVTVTVATELGLPDVAEKLRPLLTQTQDHVIDLRDALGL